MIASPIAGAFAHSSWRNFRFARNAVSAGMTTRKYDVALVALLGLVGFFAVINIACCPTCPTAPAPTMTAKATTKTTVPGMIPSRTPNAFWSTTALAITNGTSGRTMGKAIVGTSITETTVLKQTIAKPIVAEITKDLPFGYVRISGFGAYKPSKTRKSWVDARRICSQDGAYLAVPNTHTEMAMLWTIMTPHNIHLIHVGFNYRRGSFVSVLGEHMTTMEHSLWAYGEPSGGSVYGCTYLSRRGLVSERCGDLEFFVCEI